MDHYSARVHECIILYFKKKKKLFLHGGKTTCNPNFKKRNDNLNFYYKYLELDSVDIIEI